MLIRYFLLAAVSCSIVSCSLFRKKIQCDIESDLSIADQYAADISKDDLKEHLSIIASDDYEGRETTMPGQKKAAAYIENHFKNIGLAPGLGNEGYQQPFPVKVSDPSKVQIDIDGNQLTFLEDFYYLGFVSDTSFSNRDIYYIGYGIDQEGISDYNGIDVKGKFVLVKEGIPENRDDINYEWASWRRKLLAAKSHGAIGMITIQESFDQKVEIIRSYLANPSMQLHEKGLERTIAIPNIYIHKRVADEIIKYESQETTFLKQKINASFRTAEIKSSENVLGYLEGTDLKDELVVITAHYDHIGYDNGEVCNGADDDGSGTVSVLELAESFMKAKKEGNGPRRSILFMTVSGEEKGLFGSYYYSENPVFPLESTVADLNIDMIGRKDSLHENTDYVYLIGADRISMDLHLINEQVNKEKVNTGLDYKYNHPNDPNHFYMRSDHYNFAKHGIPVIFYFSGVHEDYHKPTDDVEKIDFDALQKRSKLVFYTAWELANRTERIRINSPKYKEKDE